MFKIGKVSHFYDKIGVAIVELDGNLATGDSVRFMKDGVLVGATYWESPDSPTDGFMFHEVSLAQPAGTYIFTIEAMRTGSGSSLSQNKLTVVVL